MTGRGGQWRIPLWIFLGSLFVQAAWVLAVPPFRGIDEFDHAFRAASVAQGHILPGPPVEKDGRGNLVVAPRALVDAATPECELYKYEGSKNCEPVHSVGGGNVAVASAAATYNPVFYWLIGTLALPFHGVVELYVMRIGASLACSLLLALAAWQTSLWSSTKWPIVGLIAAMTPMTIYSTILPAPNGIEMMAGVSVWAGLLGITDQRLPSRMQRLLIVSLIPACITLVTVRLLGPLWLGMIVLSALLLSTSAEVLALLRRHMAAVTVLTIATWTAVAAGIGWSVAAGAVTPVDARVHHPHPDPLANSLVELPMWVLQTIGVFPTRTEAAPMPVYAIGLLLFGCIIWAGLRPGSMRRRLAFGSVTLASLAVPLAMVFATYSRIGDEWQGRYVLPYALGIPLIASIGLDHAGYRHRLERPVLVSGWASLAAANSLSIVHVLLMERAGNPLAGTNEWYIPPVWLVVTLAFVGLAFWALAVRHESRLGTSRPAAAELNGPKAGRSLVASP